MAFQTEAVVTTPVDFAERTIVCPDRNFHFLIIITINPNFLSKIDFLYGVSTTSEEQMLLVKNV